MDNLIETLVFFFGALGACALILTGWFVVSSFVRFLEDSEKDKQINLLKKEIKEMDERRKAQLEIERLRYERECMIRRK